MIPLVITLMPEDDNKAFMEDLYQQYHRLMFHVAYQATKDTYIVEELVSDGCIALIRNVAKLKTLETIQLRAYIVNVMKSKIRDYFDRKKAQSGRYAAFDDVAYGVADQSEDIEKHIILQEELDAVQTAIDALPKNERLAVLLMNQEVDYHTISRIVGISEASVHKYISRARSKIRANVYGKEE